MFMLVMFFMMGFVGNSYAQGQYYRYVNAEGVKVLGHSIPPQYVANGYEVLSSNGRVIRIVEPAPDPELVEIERAKAVLKAKYEQLSRRYSNVRDIDAAKLRKLVHVEASILLVEASIENIKNEIDSITARAADFERAGKAVPQNLLDTLKALNEKMEATLAIQQQRFDEKNSIAERFAAEKKLFTEGVENFDPTAAQKLQVGDDSEENEAAAPSNQIEGSSVNEEAENGASSNLFAEYPKSIVDISLSRKQAIENFKRAKNENA